MRNHLLYGSLTPPKEKVRPDCRYLGRGRFDIFDAFRPCSFQGNEHGNRNNKQVRARVRIVKGTDKGKRDDRQ